MIELFRSFRIWKENPGVISRGTSWCCSYSSYLHIHDNLHQLLWEVITEFRHDRHLVGY